MKKLFLLLSLLFIVTSFGQIQERKVIKPIVIGEVETLGKFVASLKYYEADGNNYYFITYNNLKYKHITDFKNLTFLGTKEDLNTLYKMFIEVLNSSEKNYTKEITLGKDNISIVKQKTLGIESIYIFNGTDYFTLTKEQINKLFNIN